MTFPLRISAVLLALSSVAFAEPTPEAPAIALKQIDARTWRATYEISAPVERLGFIRTPTGWRAESWLPTDAAFELVHSEDGEFARRKDGRPFRKVALEIPARYISLPKDYAPFSPFSDGGLLIYTGQFHACPDAGECEIDAWPMSVAPPKGAHIIVDGAMHKKQVDFETRDDGANLYVGAATPLASSHFVGVVDPALPATIQESLNTLLPKLMDYFAERLGPLAQTPMLFASLDPDPPSGSGLSSQGGTLPGQIFMHLYGEAWRTADPKNFEGFVPWFFAHEAGHLFQEAGISRGFAMDQSWIHEGSADAFAALTIADLGGASPDYVKGRIDGAYADCAKGLRALGDKPLNASGEAGAFGNYYACGLLMQLAIDADVKRANNDAKDLFDAWALYLERARAGAPTDQETYLGAAESLGATRAARFARALATTAQDDPQAFLSTELSALGIEVEATSSP